MFAFVLMPFASAFDDVYKFGIKETAEKLGIKAERVDEQIFHKQNILERIYSQIESADFIISDMTGRNPNVFYETGYAHGVGKTCLLLTSNADDIPFDLKHHRHIIYGASIQNLRQSLEKDLIAVKAQVINRKSAIACELSKIDGTLEKSRYFAYANIDLFFDLKNKTNSPSPEIEAIYFHTGKGWSFSQDGQACVATKSDNESDLQHFVKAPVRRLSAGAWAPFKISGRKIVDRILDDGDGFKDSYKLAGSALITVVTVEGAYEYPMNIDYDVDEIPF